jgi:hypothetical protein
MELYSTSSHCPLGLIMIMVREPSHALVLGKNILPSLSASTTSTMAALQPWCFPEIEGQYDGNLEIDPFGVLHQIYWASNEKGEYE